MVFQKQIVEGKPLNSSKCWMEYAAAKGKARAFALLKEPAGNQYP